MSAQSEPVGGAGEAREPDRVVGPEHLLEGRLHLVPATSKLPDELQRRAFAGGESTVRLNDADPLARSDPRT